MQSEENFTSLTIHGSNEKYAVNPIFKVFRDENLIGEIGHKEVISIKIHSDCEIKFKLGFRTTKVRVRKGIDRHIFLSTNRFSGGINAIVSDDDNVNTIQSQIERGAKRNNFKTIIFILSLLLIAIYLQSLT